MFWVDGYFGAVGLSAVWYAFFEGLVDGDWAVGESFVVSVEGVDCVCGVHTFALFVLPPVYLILVLLN